IKTEKSAISTNEKPRSFFISIPPPEQGYHLDVYENSYVLFDYQAYQALDSLLWHYLDWYYLEEHIQIDSERCIK
ncbi:TPA: hypothetical protein ACHXLT_005192, partial [Escherichia coli]